MAEREDWKSAIRRQRRVDAEHERREEARRRPAPTEREAEPSDFDAAVRTINALMREMRAVKKHLRALQARAEPAVEVIRGYAAQMAERAKTAEYRTADLKEAQRYADQGESEEETGE